MEPTTKEDKSYPVDSASSSSAALGGGDISSAFGAVIIPGEDKSLSSSSRGEPLSPNHSKCDKTPLGRVLSPPKLER
jgi:hypothetical protein